jgi:hypothetical protein
MVRIIEAEVEVDALTAQFTEFARMKSLIDDLSLRQKELRDSLMALIEAEGEEDDKGHLWLNFEEPINGYVAIQRQRKVAQSLDPDIAERIIRSRGLYDKCYTLVPVLDEAAIMAAHYEGDLSAEEIDAMFPSKVTYAFVPKK